MGIFDLDMSQLESIKSTPLSSFDVDGGRVLHGIKNDDIGFVDFERYTFLI